MDKKVKVTPAGESSKSGPSGFEPTQKDREQVEALVSFGVPQKDICAFVRTPDDEPISVDTLRKHFRKELDTASTKANAKVAMSLFKKAMDGDTASIIFWLKTRARWHEVPQQVAFTDPDGKPVAPPTLADFYKTVEMVKDGKAEGSKAKKGEG